MAWYVSRGRDVSGTGTEESKSACVESASGRRESFLEGTLVLEVEVLAMQRSGTCIEVWKRRG